MPETARSEAGRLTATARVPKPSFAVPVHSQGSSHLLSGTRVPNELYLARRLSSAKVRHQTRAKESQKLEYVISLFTKIGPLEATMAFKFYPEWSSKALIVTFKF